MMLYCRWERMVGRIALAALAVALLVGGVIAQEKAAKPAEFGLAIFKLGEKHATDKQAGKPVDDFCKLLSDRIDGAAFVNRGVRNDPAKALTLLEDDKQLVAVAIVSPGFYFAQKKTLTLTVLAEARRAGHSGEQFVLVGAEALKKYPAARRVATNLDGDLDWLNKVVLPAPDGAKPVIWVHYDNLFDAAYEIIDEDEGAPDCVLVDRVTLAAMLKDEDLKKLGRGLKSKLLPQDLVVELDGRLGKKRDDLKKVLKALDETAAGIKVGKNLQSATFPAADDKRLAAAEKLYGAKDGDG